MKELVRKLVCVRLEVMITFRNELEVSEYVGINRLRETN
jgi:hypothetical protein